MERSTQTTWLVEGFTILKDTGAAGLTIKNLTTRLNKSKGSFYHHFKNRDDYSEKLLAYWEEWAEALVCEEEACNLVQALVNTAHLAARDLPTHEPMIAAAGRYLVEASRTRRDVHRRAHDVYVPGAMERKVD